MGSGRSLSCLVRGFSVKVPPPKTVSSAGMFAARGNPWLSDKDRDKDFPMSRSRMADEPISDEELSRASVRDKMHVAMGKIAQDFARPKPSLNIDPDMDCFTKASKAFRDEFFEPVKPPPIVSDFARRAAGVARKMNAELNTLERNMTGGLRMSKTDKLSCPYSCGYMVTNTVAAGKAVSLHLRQRLSCPRGCGFKACTAVILDNHKKNCRN